MKRLIIALFVMASAQASAMTLYVDPAAGNDANGCGYADPCRSLNGAQALLQSTKPSDDVLVSVADGVVKNAEPIIWRYSNAPHTVTIRGAGNSVTVFDGAGDPGTWLTIATAKAEAAMLTVERIGVRRFGTGITIAGNRDDYDQWISRVTINSMRFEYIGGKWTTDKSDRYGAVRLVNARFVTVRNSRFYWIENAGRPELLHAIYLAHYSSAATVESNVFSVVSGDPVRVRDASNNNLFTDNWSNRAGRAAHFSEWYCSGSNCTKAVPERPSCGNVITYNEAGTAYDGSSIPLFALFGAGSSGCEKRLSTAGNLKL